MTAYQAGVRERLKAAELAWVEAQTRAEEAQARAVLERSRRRRTVALAASVLALIVLGVGGWAYLARQRVERLAVTTRVVADALAEAERFRGRAQQSVGDPAKWSTAVAAARRARDFLAQAGPDGGLRSRVADMLAELEREQIVAAKQAAEIERDRKLLGELEAIRASRIVHWEPKRSDDEYAEAFRGFGIDPDQLDPKEAAKRIAQRSEPVELAAYLDDWVTVRRKVGDMKEDATWRRLIMVAQAIDPDPWRAALREQIGQNDRVALLRLASDQRTLEARSVRDLTLLASALKEQGDRDRAEQVLRRAWRLAPNDFWVNFELGAVYLHLPGRLDEAARFFSMSVAIRPRSCAAHNNLGKALFERGKLEEGIAEFREALRIKPNELLVHSNLGRLLSEQGKLEEAVAEYREALRIKPDDSYSHGGLGRVLSQEKKWAGAAAELREGLRLNPRDTGILVNLGIALKEQGKLDEAIDKYHEALRIKPDDPHPHANLGVTFRAQGEFTVAVAEFRKARDLARNDPRLAQGIEKEMNATERLASLASRLPAVLGGKLKPVDASETLGFAEVCYRKKLHVAAARFWAAAFQSRPSLADDLQSRHRYSAACDAALAGCGQGKDDPPLDEKTKVRWRKQAIDWLKADLAAWKILESGPPQARQSISETLQHWKADRDLAGLRDPAALGKLPEDEQKACRALWAEVDALLKKARDAKP